MDVCTILEKAEDYLYSVKDIRKYREGLALPQLFLDVDMLSPRYYEEVKNRENDNDYKRLVLLCPSEDDIFNIAATNISSVCNIIFYCYTIHI